MKFLIALLALIGVLYLMVAFSPFGMAVMMFGRQIMRYGSTAIAFFLVAGALYFIYKFFYGRS